MLQLKIIDLKLMIKVNNNKMKKTIVIICVVALGVFVLGFLYYTLSAKQDEKRAQEISEKARIAWENRPVWKKKIVTEQDLKIGLITDTQVHPNRVDKSNKVPGAPRYLDEKYLAPLNKFVAQMELFQPQMIMHLGDVIEGTNDPDHVGIQGVELVRDEMAKVGVPIHWAIGNHELRSMTKEQFKETLSLDALDKVLDVGDYRFIFLDANYYPDGTPVTVGGKRFIPGYLHPTTLAWLEEQVQTDKLVFIFIHHGAYEHDLPGDEGKMKQPMKNSADVREVLRKYNIDGYFNGHMEARYYEQDGTTHFYSLPGTKKSKTYPQSYYELTLTDGQPDLTMYYTDPNSGASRVIDFESDENPQQVIDKNDDN